MQKILIPIWFVAIAGGQAGVAAAQHEGHKPATPTAHATGHPEEMEAPHAGVLGLPMTRHGSGTAWLPDDSPMRAAHYKVGGWDVMLHGNLFVGYDYQATDAGESEVVSQNWIMAMAGHPLGGGMFEARTMLSLEPLTLGDNGYPLLLQTGETLEGMPLVDRQHPHDLFMEIAGRYEREVAGGVAFQLFGGLAGEPALGPVAFPHRPAAMADPMAPLTHHWLDSTHISFGVLTAGVFRRRGRAQRHAGRRRRSPRAPWTRRRSTRSMSPPRPARGSRRRSKSNSPTAAGSSSRSRTAINGCSWCTARPTGSQRTGLERVRFVPLV